MRQEPCFDCGAIYGHREDCTRVTDDPYTLKGPNKSIVPGQVSQLTDRRTTPGGMRGTMLPNIPANPIFKLQVELTQARNDAQAHKERADHAEDQARQALRQATEAMQEAAVAARVAAEALKENKELKDLLAQLSSDRNINA